MSRFDFRLLVLAVLPLFASWSPLQAQSATPAAVTLTVSSSANPATFAAPVTFTVAVMPPASGNPAPTGTVIATLLGPFAVGLATLDSNGQAKITVPGQSGPSANSAYGLPAGSNQITFSYSGDTRYKAAQAQLTQWINPANTTTTATMSAAQPARITATVTIDEPNVSTTPFSLPGFPGASAPTGTVQFFNGSSLLATVTLVPGGLFTSTAALVSDDVPANLSAVYSGDNNYNSSSSSGSTGGGGGTVTLSATSSANPATFAEPVTLNIAVTSATTPIPTGSVSATLAGVLDLGTVLLDATGHASLDIPRDGPLAAAVVPWGLPVGSDSITLNYRGDAHYASTLKTISQTVAMANTATTAALKAGNSGAPTIVATVSIDEPSVTPLAFLLPGGGSTSPTGNVQFLSGSTVIGSAPLNPSGHLQSTAILPAVQTPSSTASITAVYNGDGNYNGSTSPAATQPPTIVPTMGVSSSANPSTFAEPVTFTVTVASQTAGGPIPTGSVSASVLGSDSLGSATLDKNGSATITVPPQYPSASPVLPWGLATGSNAILFNYSGDFNYAASQAKFSQLVNQSNTSTRLLFPPTAFGIYIIQASVRIDENSVSATDFAIPAGGNLSTSPSGIVTFFDGATQVGTAKLAAGGLFQATASLQTASAIASPRAVYAGDTNYTGSSSGAGGTGGAPVTVTLASSTNPAIYGQAFTVVATLTPTSATGPTPTGAVTFYDSGQNLKWTAALDKTGKASLPIPIPLATPLVCAPQCYSAEVEVLAAGSHTITVSYSGDANYAPYTPSVSVTETIDKAPTNTTTAQLTSAASAQGAQIVQATVADAQPPAGGPYHFMVPGASGLADGNPSGSVQIFSGATLLGTPTLSPNPGGDVTSSASVSIATPDADLSSSAVYPGDANFLGSSSLSVSSLITLASNPNPSAVGQQVTLTATLALVAASGNVQFFDGKTLLGLVSLTNGVATLPVTFNTPGAHSLTAVYLAQLSALAAISPAYTQTVLAVSGQEILSLTANPEIAVYGQPITLSAQLTGSVTIPPSGSVIFLDGATKIGAGVLSAQGAASATVTLPVGLHQLTATYAGDANWSAATSGMLPLPVLRAFTTTALKVSGNTLNATVTAIGPGAGTPTGTVEFVNFMSRQVLGTANLVSGIATLTVTSATAIPVGVRAVYTGDSNFNASTSATGATPFPVR